VLAELAITCSLLGTGEFVLPDRRCTPSQWHNVPARQVRAEACKPNKPRAHIPIGLKRQILANYGMTETAPYPKDRLETYARTRYCAKKNLSMKTIRAWFKGDWRSRYRFYDRRNWPL
jgi:hypothetical protein